MKVTRKEHNYVTSKYYRSSLVGEDKISIEKIEGVFYSENFSKYVSVLKRLNSYYDE